MDTDAHLVRRAGRKLYEHGSPLIQTVRLVGYVLRDEIGS